VKQNLFLDPGVCRKRSGLEAWGEPPPTVKEVVIKDKEFAEQVLHRRRGRVAMERGFT
jgi:hypothetical protein